MINSLDIKKLQSHKDTHLEFDPGVNIIVGTSDSGKTAIFRALNWVINNKPSGDSLKRHGSKEISVFLNLGDDGVNRVKSNTQNVYYLQNNNEEGESIDFTAFRQSVPEEITKILNIQSINFQQQMDPPFLLSSSPGEVAQVLNKAVNLDIIDRALTGIGKLSRDTQQEIKTAETLITQLEEDMGEFDHLPQLEKDIQKLEKVDKEIQSIVEKEDDLILLINQHKKIATELADLSDFLKIKGKVRVLSEKADRRAGIAENRVNLSGIVRSIKDTKGEITEYQQITRAGRAVTHLSEINTKYDLIQGNNIKLIQLSRAAQIAANNINFEEVAVNQLKKQFDKLMPNECPLCGKGK